MEWGKLFGALGIILIMWLLFRTIKNNPSMMTKANLSKSFSTMGMLSLMLIAFVAACIYFLRAG